MPQPYRMIADHAKPIAFKMQEHNGRDYVVYDDTSSGATCVDLGDGKVKFELYDGRVATLAGHWIVWKDASDGGAHEFVMKPGDGDSDGKHYVQIDGHWVHLDNSKSWVNIKGGRYMLLE